MRIGPKMGAALAAMVAVAAMLVASGSASATGGDEHGATGKGEARGQGTIAVMTFEFDVAQHSADPRDASGSFHAQGIGPGNAVLDLRGPATCVDVRGNQVGFLYPVEPGSQPAPFVGQTIFISAQDNGPGAPDSLTFVGPAPAAVFPGCAPVPGVLPITPGDVVVDDHG